MSRLGKKPIAIPKGAEARVEGRVVHVKGPKGELAVELKSVVDAKVEEGNVILTPHNQAIQTRALWGTYASLIKGALKGVTEGYEIKLLIEGVGYKMDVKGDKVALAVGLSHGVELKIPAGIKVTAEKGSMTIQGADKQAVGEFAAVIRSNKKPEPYKGKGIRYDGEVIRRKQGKRGA
jgi:large subunit ribosomal protein L6